MENGPWSDYPFWIGGRALVYTGQPEKALPQLKRAVELARRISDSVGLSEVLAVPAEAQLAAGKISLALDTARKAEEVATRAKLGINLAQVKLWRRWVEMEADPGLATRHISSLHQSVLISRIWTAARVGLYNGSIG